jgi:hypothetical protein
MLTANANADAQNVINSQFSPQSVQKSILNISMDRECVFSTLVTLVDKRYDH